MADPTLFFYDLETSGVSSRSARIMQFAGQRTTLSLEPIGKPENHLIKLSNDILPEVGAVLLTGITPQMTVADGMTEAEFLKIFHKDIATPGTVFVGFNNVRFDDEFIRFVNYRNYYDPYEWHWADGKSRWDMLDVVRMTRALRPDGIKWPVASDGSPTNRLESLAKINELLHDKAHDALSDVEATIAVARLIQEKQPKLFDHMLSVRDKRAIGDLVQTGRPFSYTSGKYPSRFLHTTAAILLGNHPKNQGVYVYDLRIDPDTVKDLPVAEIIERWQHRCAERPCTHPRFPVKTMQFNRCPAVAPLGVIDEVSAARIQLDMDTVQQNLNKLRKMQADLYEKVLAATTEMDATQATMFGSSTDADNALYDNFLPSSDKKTSASLRQADPSELAAFADKFDDARLRTLLPRYIARNYPKALTDDLRTEWEAYRRQKLLDGDDKSAAARYFTQLTAAAADTKLTQEQKFLLEELQLWGESILPVD